MKLLNEQNIINEWSPRLVSKLGKVDESKLAWMSKMCHYMVNESQTHTNTLGMGGIATPTNLGSQFGFHTGDVGSGDKFPTLLPLAIQVAGRAVGFDIVDVIPMPGPSFQLSYLDYVYSGGKLDSVAPPTMFKVEVEGAYTKGTQYTLTGASSNVLVTFIARSRMDGDAIFRLDTIVTTGATLATAIVNGTTTIDDDTPTTQTVTSKASLVKAFEEHIGGFVGAGYNDTDDFAGEFRDGNSLLSGMSRQKGEGQDYRTMSLQTFSKNVEAKTIQVAGGVTMEQIQDMGKQYGVDVLSMVEGALVNELSQHINKELLDRCFSLGWTNHSRFASAENGGTAINLNLGGAVTNVTYTNMLGQPQALSTGADVIVPGNFENTQTIQRKIFSRVLAVNAIIVQRGRRGPATFIVTNSQLATALQDNAHFQASPTQNTLSQSNGSLYQTGTINGMQVYVDPTMAWQDTRVLVGRKGGNTEPGVKFMPYLMAESVQTIAEGTMSPKIAIKSRYALVDAGFHPETQYFTFYVTLGQQII